MSEEDNVSLFDYKIVEKDNLEELEREVIRLIAEGYECSGGHVATKYISDVLDRHGNLQVKTVESYSQAMVLYP